MEKKEINWKERAQEAEGELSILRGIETNRVKEAQARSNQLQDELDRVKKENNDLYNKIADLTESLKSKDYFEKPDYQYLIDENRKLEEERKRQKWQRQSKLSLFVPPALATAIAR